MFRHSTLHPSTYLSCIWRLNRVHTTPKAQRLHVHLHAGQQRDERFKILFMGRDDFSCLILRELYAASGQAYFQTSKVTPLMLTPVKICRFMAEYIDRHKP